MPIPLPIPLSDSEDEDGEEDENVRSAKARFKKILSYGVDGTTTEGEFDVAVDNELDSNVFYSTDSDEDDESVKSSLATSGEVLDIGDGVAKVSGLFEVLSGELVAFKNTVPVIYGIALNLGVDYTGVVLLGDDRYINQGTVVTGTGEVVSVKEGFSVLGKVFDPLSSPIDGSSDIAYFSSNYKYKSVNDRTSYSDVLKKSNVVKTKNGVKGVYVFSKKRKLKKIKKGIFSSMCSKKKFCRFLSSAAARKPAAKKPAVKKVVAKKAVVKKPTTRKVVATKPAKKTDNKIVTKKADISVDNV